MKFFLKKSSFFLCKFNLPWRFPLRFSGKSSASASLFWMVAFSIWQVLRKADVVGAQAATGVSMHTGSWFSAGKLVSELVIRPRGLRDVLGVDLELGVEATLHCTAFTLSSRGRRGVRCTTQRGKAGESGLFQREPLRSKATLMSDKVVQKISCFWQPFSTWYAIFCWLIWFCKILLCLASIH